MTFKFNQVEQNAVKHRVEQNAVFDVRQKG